VSIKLVVTRGFGNGTYTGDPILLVSRGYLVVGWVKQTDDSTTWTEQTAGSDTWTPQTDDSTSWA